MMSMFMRRGLAGLQVGAKRLRFATAATSVVGGVLLIKNSNRRFFADCDGDGEGYETVAVAVPVPDEETILQFSLGEDYDFLRTFRQRLWDTILDLSIVVIYQLNFGGILTPFVAILYPLEVSRRVRRMKINGKRLKFEGNFPTLSRMWFRHSFGSVITLGVWPTYYWLTGKNYWKEVSDYVDENIVFDQN